MTNDNLIELVDLVPEERLDWTPEPTEWSTHVIVTHIILARLHHVMTPGPDEPQISDIVADCRSKDGLKRHLRSSWGVIAALLSDPEKLDALHGPPIGTEPEYIEPEVYDGHFVAYHRMAHDLHHRSTIVGHLGKLGIRLDGWRIRPL